MSDSQLEPTQLPRSCARLLEAVMHTSGEVAQQRGSKLKKLLHCFCFTRWKFYENEASKFSARVQLLRSNQLEPLAAVKRSDCNRRQMNIQCKNRCSPFHSNPHLIITCTQCIANPGPVYNFLRHMWHLKCFAFWCWMRIFSSSNSRWQYLKTPNSNS